jgi:hypothetical protein
MTARGRRPIRNWTGDVMRPVLLCWLLLVAGCSWLPLHPPGCSCSSCTTAAKPSITDVGRAVDRLALEVDDSGTIVIKRPDVWGDGKLTRSRVEFETQMASELGKFRQAISAQAAVSDRVMFESQSVVGVVPGSPGPTPGSASSQVASTTSNGNYPAQPEVVAGGQLLGQRDKLTENTAFLAAHPGVPAKFGDMPGIESTVYLDEKKRFLDHLEQIRRVNLGDDTSDSAGYGFYLLRLPVSIQPGRKTQIGHGALLNVTVRHEFDPEFTARTFRNLAINDLVNLLTPLIYNLLTHPGWEGPLEAYEEAYKDLESWHGLHAEVRFALVRKIKDQAQCLVPANHDLKMCFPISRGDLVSVFLVENLARIARETRPRVMGDDLVHHELLADGGQATGRGPGRPMIPLPRASHIRNYLRQELEAAYDLMSDPNSEGKGLAKLTFIDELAATLGKRGFDGEKNPRPNIPLPLSQEANTFAQNYPKLVMEELPGNLRQRMLGALCWAIAVEAALLDQQIRKEASRILVADHHAGDEDIDSLRFYDPRPDPATARVFEDYVRRRWPLIVFALDPVTDQQNIADSRQVDREFQLAAAFAAASGHVGVNQLANVMRQTAKASDTVDLNRTVTAFVHGNESFGWRFTPRYQNPQEIPNHLKAFAEAAIHPLAHDSRAQTARIEPGQRELAAVVLMPSMLPRVCLTTHANWYCLDDPGRPLIPSDQAMEHGRQLQLVRQTLDQTRDAACYRPADVAVLATRVDEIESRLPMQVCSVDLPYQNSLGGFELFTPGSTALLPELVGYEGVERLCPSGGDAILLLARNLDLNMTRVVVGGRLVATVHCEILSRETLRVVVPSDIRPQGRKSVEVYVATPNGVSNRLLIPLGEDVAKPVSPGPQVPSPSPPARPAQASAPAAVSGPPARATPSGSGNAPPPPRGTRSRGSDAPGNTALVDAGRPLPLRSAKRARA